jgi:hypothetical protein
MALPTASTFTPTDVTVPAASFYPSMDNYSDGREAAGAVIHIPMGNNVFIQKGGVKPAKRQIKVFVLTKVAYEALAACLDQDGALVLDGWDTRSAYLHSVGTADWTWGGKGYVNTVWTVWPA